MRNMLSTSVNAFIGLNIQIVANGQPMLVTRPLLPCTSWVQLWYRLRGLYYRTCQRASRRPASSTSRLAVAGKLLNIGFNSTLFGLGVLS